MTPLEQEAWDLYCKETAGSMDVRDFWHELSAAVKEVYLHKALAKRAEKEKSHGA